MTRPAGWIIPVAAWIATTGHCGATPRAATEAVPGIANPAHTAAGGRPPPGPYFRNPYRDQVMVARAGATLFRSMHCSDCHGDGAAGWVGPNLGNRRWRYGGSDATVFRSIFYGRPRGMPAFGGMLGAQGVWVLVTYLRSLSPPPDQPTEVFTRR